MQFLNLPTEIHTYISDFLSIIDKQNLKYTNNYFNSNIKITLSCAEKSLVNYINRKTESEIGREIIGLIKENKGYIIIVGSSIVQSLDNSFNKNSDIDIIIYYKPKLSQSKQLYKEILSIIKNNTNLNRITSRANYICDIGNVETFILDKKNDEYLYSYSPVLQIITTRHNLYNLHQHFFDFSFNRNYYDGNNFYSLSKQHMLKKIGFMNTWQILKSYSREASYTDLCEHMLDRIGKVLKRGMHIINLDQRIIEIPISIRKELIDLNICDTYSNHQMIDGLYYKNICDCFKSNFSKKIQKSQIINILYDNYNYEEEYNEDYYYEEYDNLYELAKRYNFYLETFQ
jgi:hypothetical protein